MEDASVWTRVLLAWNCRRYSIIDQVLAMQTVIAECILQDLPSEQRKQFYALLLQLIENKDLSIPSKDAFK
ncbi:hypothetical protein ACSNN5_10230 [Brevibacillus formosus]|uniref:hypothetical protein n=1 Tax=Brevibacillus formosus TaxID=54913 RepID=UPI003F1C5725